MRYSSRPSTALIVCLTVLTGLLSAVLVGLWPDTGGAIAAMLGGLGGRDFPAGQASATATPVCTPAPGPWVVRAPLPYQARGVSLASDGRYIYANGGSTITNTYEIHNETNRYDPVSDVWTPLAPSPDRHTFAPAVYGDNGKIYVLGGSSSADANFIYDIASNTWSRGAPLPGALSEQAAGYYNGKIYIAGGGGLAIETWSYDIAANSWTRLADMPQATTGAGFGVINGKLYVAGGIGSPLYNTLFAYDIALNSWAQLADMPLGVEYPGSSVLMGKLWVFGGYASLQTDATQIYDPATNTWSSGPRLNVARAALYGATVGNDIAAIGGGRGPGDELGTNEISSSPPAVCATHTATPTPTQIASPTVTVTPTPTRVGCPPRWSAVPGLNAGVALRGVAASYFSPAQALSNVWVGGDDGLHTFVARGSDYHDHFDWDLETTVDVGTQANQLNAVAALNPGDLWTVGYYANSDSWDQTLIEHSNGTSWSVVPSRNIAQGGNRLTGVAAVSVNDVWAVGYYCSINCSSPPYNGDGTVIEHWNGSQWSIVPSPSPGRASVLTAVTAISMNDVWAAGSYLGTSSGIGESTLTMHWNGIQWSVVPSPNTSISSYPQNNLYSVSAASANDVWAVGAARFGLGHYRVLILHWDGIQWSAVDAPSPGFYTNYLYGVEAAGAGNVWAVGNMVDFGTPLEALILHWDGSQWNQFVAPEGFATLYAVVALHPGYIWAVGQDAVNSRVVGRYQDAFSDVYTTDYFYEQVKYLYCEGAVSGYADSTFRPYNYTTRGQVSKIIVLAKGWPLQNPGTPTFNDVPAGSAFFQYVETAYAHNIISGYQDGTFRPNTNVTRGQLSKIVVLAQGWQLENPGSATFTDVPVGSPFFRYVETAYAHYIISGYSDHTFRPGNNATRGQISKIVYNAVTSP